MERREDPNAKVQINEVYSVTKETRAVCRSLVGRVDGGGRRTGEQLRKIGSGNTGKCPQSQAETLYSQQTGRGE